jgi:hypothetical protein
MGPRGAALLVLIASAATIGLLVGTTVPGFTFLILPIVALTVGVGWGVRRASEELRWVLPALIALGAAVSVFSIVTGVLNGLSDEPYSTPAYASLGWQLYTRPLELTYVQYGATHSLVSYYVYLPLLAFLQVPGLDYRWVSLAAWAGGMYLLRRDPFAAGGFATAWIPLLAANGQNDFVPLLALTLTVSLPHARLRWGAEVLALALKQPANIFVFVYHCARKEYLRAVAAIAITFAILAPFLWINAGAVYCHAIIGAAGNTCAGQSWTFFVFKRNYWLYPSWALVVFHRPIGRWFDRVVRKLPAPMAAPPGA